MNWEQRVAFGVPVFALATILGLAFNTPLIPSLIVAAVAAVVAVRMAQDFARS